MARVSTYLDFPRSTEQACVFCRSVFGAEFNGPIHRFAEVPVARLAAKVLSDIVPGRYRPSDRL
jgi:hypothetical protein